MKAFGKFTESIRKLKIVSCCSLRLNYNNIIHKWKLLKILTRAFNELKPESEQNFLKKAFENFNRGNRKLRCELLQFKPESKHKSFISESF